MTCEVMGVEWRKEVAEGKCALVSACICVCGHETCFDLQLVIPLGCGCSMELFGSADQLHLDAWPHAHIHWCACMVGALAFGMGTILMLTASLPLPVLSLTLLHKLFTLRPHVLVQIFLNLRRLPAAVDTRMLVALGGTFMISLLV